MRANSMDIYAAEPDETLLDKSPRNLFVLRWDIRTFQFDSGNLVVVPIDGRMITHFIDRSRELQPSHNQPFDSSHLSHEFLFARFAWAILKWARTSFMSHLAADRKAFNLKNRPCCSEEVMRSDDGDGDEPVDSQQNRRYRETKGNRQQEKA